MTPRGDHAARLFERALLRSAQTAGLVVTVVATDATRWASVTFTGARHRLVLCGDADDGLDAWLAALPEADLPMGGHLVAELVVGAVSRDGPGVTIVIEALTVEEG